MKVVSGVKDHQRGKGVRGAKVFVQAHPWGWDCERGMSSTRHLVIVEQAELWGGLWLVSVSVQQDRQKRAQRVEERGSDLLKAESALP